MKIFVVFLLALCSLEASPLVKEKFLTRPASRINGGQAANAGQFPFAAAIYYQTNPSGYYFCGGALINTQWILTAARCTENAISFSINLGSTHLNGSDKVTVSTSHFEAHPDYNSETFEHDVALLKLRLAITFTDYIHQIYLPGNPLMDGDRVSAIGWGQTNDDEAGIVNELQHVQLVTLSNQECQLSYSTQITDNMVCVEGNNNEGACNGDLGGPIVQYQPRSPILHVGISSFVGPSGCESNEPSGYTRTQPYVSWIRGVTTNTIKVL